MSYPNPPDQPPAFQPAYGPPPWPAHLRGRVPRLLGWIFLALAIVLFVVGGVIIATKSLGKVNGFHRISFSSGSGSATLNGTGKWVGYYEADNISNDTTRIPSFQVTVVGPSGTAVDVQPYGNRSDGKVKKLYYDYNGHKGLAAFQFTASQTGRYQIKVVPGASVASGADVAIGRDIETGTVVGGLLIGLGVLALVAAIILLIVGFVKRGRHKRQLQSAPYYGGGYGNPPPPPPPGYGGYGPPPPAPPGYGSHGGYGEQPSG